MAAKVLETAAEYDSASNTPSLSASLLCEAKRLLAADRYEFVRLIHELEAQAKEVESHFLGDRHPLADIFGRWRESDSADRLEVGIREYRRTLDEPLPQD